MNNILRSHINGNNRNIPQLTTANNIRSNGTVLQQQSNSNNRAVSYNHIQALLKRHYKVCFITTKVIKAGDKRVPIGTAGKIVESKTRGGQYCCIFAAPYAGIEAVVNPVLCLNFGTFLMYIHKLIGCLIKLSKQLRLSVCLPD